MIGLSMRIGIPRALLAYYYLPLWETFFEQLGAEVVVSPSTNKALLDRGVQMSVDEACLPVKVYLGHVHELKNRVDVLFLPRIVSVEPGKYTCPKLLGMPDMVKNNIPDLPPIWNDTVNLSKRHRDIFPIVYRLGIRVTRSVVRIMKAYWLACRRQHQYESLIRLGYAPEEAYESLKNKTTLPKCGLTPELTLAVVGHAYNIYDPYTSMRIIERLRAMGIRVITPEMMNPTAIHAATTHMGKDLFWTYCKRIMGTACHYIQKREPIDGIINIVAFGCGPDSLVGEMLERAARRNGEIPFMLLTIDEHTGEAGLITRLEAFLDMIRWKERSDARNFSSYGNTTSNA
jgi:predicted nucleotide-binding protein (sugar kinase/HSP70/actin superfamily)